MWRLVAPFLRAEAAMARSGWRFVFNPENLGFVATANLGMNMCDDDVVLLKLTPKGAFLMRLHVGPENPPKQK